MSKRVSPLTAIRERVVSTLTPALMNVLVFPWPALIGIVVGGSSWPSVVMIVFLTSSHGIGMPEASGGTVIVLSVSERSILMIIRPFTASASIPRNSLQVTGTMVAGS